MPVTIGGNSLTPFNLPQPSQHSPAHHHSHSGHLRSSLTGGGRRSPRSPKSVISSPIPPSSSSLGGGNSGIGISISSSGTATMTSLSGSTVASLGMSNAAAASLANSLRLNPYDLRPLTLPSPLDTAFINAAQQVMVILMSFNI